MVKLNVSIKDLLIKTILTTNSTKHYYQKTFPNSKYKLKTILDKIFFILRYGCPWNSINKYTSIYYHFQRFCQEDIFRRTYENIVKNYIKQNNSSIHIIDTSVIYNRHGCFHSLK